MTQLSAHRCELAINGMRYNIFRVNPELHTPIEEMLEPGYWAQVRDLRRGDVIEVLPEDYAYIAELLVIDAGHLYAKVAIKSVTRFDVAATDTPKGYEVKWRGPHAKYGVLRGKDVLKDGFVTKAEADEWIAEILKKAA